MQQQQQQQQQQAGSSVAAAAVAAQQPSAHPSKACVMYIFAMTDSQSGDTTVTMLLECPHLPMSNLPNLKTRVTSPVLQRFKYCTDQSSGRPTLLASVCSISTTASVASVCSCTVLWPCRRAAAEATHTRLASRWGLDTQLLPSTD
jgi:hypothetical protein